MILERSSGEGEVRVSYVHGTCSPYADYASAKAEVWQGTTLKKEQATQCWADLPDRRCESVFAGADATCLNSCLGTWKMYGRTRWRLPFAYFWLVHSEDVDCVYESALDRWTCEGFDTVVID